MERRLQVLVGHDQYAWLVSTACASHRSVASIVREAIARLASDDSARRRAAAQQILSWPLQEDPDPDWAESKAAYELDLATRFQP